MSIVNRTKDASEQRLVLNVSQQATATGVTIQLGIVPFPCTIDEAQIAVWGISGAPTYALAVNRFIAGTGFTTWVLSTAATTTPADFGVSGPGTFGASLFGSSGLVLTNASGSTLNNLLANDVLTVTSGAANTAVKAISVGVVLRPIQDVVTRFGLF